MPKNTNGVYVYYIDTAYRYELDRKSIRNEAVHHPYDHNMLSIHTTGLHKPHQLPIYSLRDSNGW